MPQQHCAPSCTDDGIKDVCHYRLDKAIRALRKWKVKCGIEEEANQELGKRLKQWKVAFEDERMKREEAESQLYKIKCKQRDCFSELRREKKERLIIEECLRTTVERMKQLESDCVHNNGKPVNLSTDRRVHAPVPAFSIDKLNGYHERNEEIGRVCNHHEDNSIVRLIPSPKCESVCSSCSSYSSLKRRRDTIEDARCNPTYQDMPRSRSSSITSNNGCTFDGSDIGKTLCYSSDSSFNSGSQPDCFCWDEDRKERGVSSFPPSAERRTISSSTGVAHSTYEGKAGCPSLCSNHTRATPKLFESTYMSPVTSPDVSAANENLEVYGYSSSSVIEQPVIVLPEENRLTLGCRAGESHEPVSGCGSGKSMATSSEICRNPCMPKAPDEIAPLHNYVTPLSPLTWDGADDLSKNGFEVKGEEQEQKQHKKTPNLLDRLLVVAPSNKWYSTQGTPGRATLKQFIKHIETKKMSKKNWSRSGLEEKQIDPEKDIHTSWTTVSAEVLMQFPGNPSHPSCCSNVAEFCFPNGIEIQSIREDDFSMTEVNELLFGGGRSRCQTGSFVFLITGNTTDVYSSDSVSELPSQPMLYGCCLSFPWLHLVVNQAGAQGISAMRAYCILSTCPVFDLHFRILSNLVDVERLMRAKAIAGAMNSHNGTLSYCDMVPILADIDARMSDLLSHVSKAYNALRPPGPGDTLHFQVSPDLEEIHYTQSAPAGMAFPLLQGRRHDFKFLEKLYTMLSAMEPWMGHTLFSTVRPSVIVQVLSALCRERQVLVVGNQPRLVSSCVLALAALLQPFPWLSPLVPILPYNMLDVLTAPVPFLMGLSLGTSPYPLDFDYQDQGNDCCYDLLDIRNQVFYSSEGSLSIMDEGEHLISQLTSLTSSIQPEKFASPIYEPTEAQRETCRGASDLIRCHMIKLCNDAASQLNSSRYCDNSGHDNITAFMRDFSNAQGFAVLFEACFGERKGVL